MKITEEMAATFNDVKIGEIFSSAEIKKRVFLKFGRNKASVIPSDYCYNRKNNGIDFEKALHLFEYTTQNEYKYLGAHFNYTGKVYHKPKGKAERCTGEMVNGIYKQQR